MQGGIFNFYKTETRHDVFLSIITKNSEKDAKTRDRNVNKRHTPLTGIVDFSSPENCFDIGIIF